MKSIRTVISFGSGLCLLGSMLALVAFFLPYWRLPAPSHLSSVSLWDVLLFLIFQQHSTGLGIAGIIGVGALLLVMLGIATLAFLAAFLRVPRWNLRRWYLALTSLLLLAYVSISLIALFIYWIGALISDPANEDPNQQTLSLPSFGAWLILIGLILALFGGMLLPPPAAEPGLLQAPERPARPPSRRPSHRWIASFVVILLLVGLVSTAQLAVGSYQPPIQSTITLNKISMVSSTEGWAVGQEDDAQGTSAGVIYHYRAGVWERDAVPSGSGPLTGIRMLSPTEGWAVGFQDLNQGSEGQILHYQDGVWQDDTLVSGTRALFSVQMLSPQEGWAVGGEGLILHYQQGSWTQVESPTNQDLFNLFMLSPTEGWAVGFDTILHYHNGAWSTAPDPSPRIALESVWMVSPTQGWIVGLSGTILQYVDGVWLSVPADTSAAQYGALWGVTMVSPSEGWAVGDGAIFHYVAGAWQAAVHLDAGISLSGIAMLSAQEGWAVGATEAPGGSAVIMHYRQGRWVQVQVPSLAH